MTIACVSRLVEVDVELSDVSTEDLEAELSSRGQLEETPQEDEPSNNVTVDDVEKIYYAFYFGRDDEAMKLTRHFVQEATGKILP